MWRLVLLVAVLSGLNHVLQAAGPLHLIPMPRQAEVREGRFAFTARTRVLLGKVDDAQDLFAAEQLLAQTQAGLGLRPSIVAVPPAGPGRGDILIVQAGRDQGAGAALERVGLSLPASLPGPYGPKVLEQAYVLAVEPEGIVLAARSAAGVFHGVQTLKQLVRAHAREGAIPCCRIVDWPDLAYRCWQNDISRGPIPTLDHLKRQVRTLSEFKLNAMTMYTENVFLNPKHPRIAPPDPLTADEARELCAYAARYHVEVLGNHQAFGHYEKTLRLPEYAHLGENGWVLSPAREETYVFLKDVIDAIAAAYPSPLFVINCDETYGLGEGASKEMVKKIGLGGVYAHHINRLTDLLRPHGKTPMMWGDIALHHRDIVPRLPKDLIVLSWAYDARPLWDEQIVPFTTLGFRFWVCPGVSNWVWIWPDHRTAVTNISNYVRDGVRHGAMGMLNTTWGDDGEQLFGYTWFPQVWAAEVSWRAALPAEPARAATRPASQPAGRPDAEWLQAAALERERRLAAFNQAFPRLFYGLDSDAVSRAIWMLEEIRRHPAAGGLSDGAYWQDPLTVSRAPTDQLKKLLAQAEEVLAILESLVVSGTGSRREPLFISGTANGDALSCMILAARRVRNVIQRQWMVRQARDRYAQAGEDVPRAVAVLRGVALDWNGFRIDVLSHHELYCQLWKDENRPDWLKTVSKRYEALAARVEPLSGQAMQAADELEKTGVWPDVSGLGLAAPLPPSRAAAPSPLPPEAKLPATPWLVGQAKWRLPIVWEAGKRDRTDAPMEALLPAGADLPADWTFALAEVKDEGQAQALLPVQVERKGSGRGQKLYLAALVPGATKAGRTRTFLLYAGPGVVGADVPQRPTGVSAAAANAGRGVPPRIPESALALMGPARAVPDDKGGFWVDTGPYRAHVMPEGGHVYEFQPKSLQGVDVTIPGESAWQGFSDTGGPSRSARYRLTLESAGPVVVRIRCVSEHGPEKLMHFWAGQPWFEVMLDQPVGYYWDFDDERLMSAGCTSPGEAVFSDAHRAPVGKAGELSLARPGTTWGLKRRPDGLTLASITPGAPSTHRVGPGGGMGGVGVEGGTARHFVTLCDVLPGEVADLCSRLEASLDARNAPKVAAGTAERR